MLRNFFLGKNSILATYITFSEKFENKNGALTENNTPSKKKFLHIDSYVVRSWWWWGLVAQSCLTFMTQWTVADQVPLSMGFTKQEYWSGLQFPSPEDLPDPEFKHRSVSLIAGGILYCKQIL